MVILVYSVRGREVILFLWKIHFGSLLTIAETIKLMFAVI